MRLASMRRGPWAMATNRALGMAFMFTSPFGGYVESILEIPEVMVTAVRLMSRHAHDDVFLHFSSDVQFPKIMDACEFDVWVSGLAQRQMSMNASLSAQMDGPSLPSEDDVGSVGLVHGFLRSDEDAQLLHQRGLLAHALGDLLQAIGHVRSDEPVQLTGPELIMHAEQAAELARDEAARAKAAPLGVRPACGPAGNENDVTLRGLLASLEGLSAAEHATPHADVADAIGRARAEVWKVVGLMSKGLDEYSDD